MLISATQDIAESSLAALAHDLREIGPVEVDGSRIFHKSAAPPSWIALWEQAPTWLVLLGPSVALFLNELLKEAAKDTWRNKAAIGRALAQPVVFPLRAAATAIARVRSAGSPASDVDVGIPVPDDYFGTRLRLEGTDAETIALELALFIHQCGALQELLSHVEGNASGGAGMISLKLLPDGEMLAEWLAAEMERRSQSFPPPAP